MTTETLTRGAILFTWGGTLGMVLYALAILGNLNL